MDDFNEEKVQDIIDILYEYDEDSGNIIGKSTREKLNKYYQKEDESSEKICKIVFELVEDDNIKEKCKLKVNEYTKEPVKTTYGYHINTAMTIF